MSCDVENKTRCASAHAQLKQELTAERESHEKRRVELTAEVESLSTRNKQLENMLKSQQISGQVERETRSQIHMETIKVGTCSVVATDERKSSR